jgi:hypothetical protein
MRTSSLDIQEDKNKEDQDNRILKFQMEDAHKAIKTLTMELAELQKLVKTKKKFFFFKVVLFAPILGNRISSTKTSDEFSTKSFSTNATQCIKLLYFFYITPDRSNCAF